jgi:MFS family permease
VYLLQWTGYGCKFLDSSAQWRLGFSIQAIPALALFFGVFFIPESPRWLCLKGREEEAEHNFRRLHGGNSSEEWLTQEFDTIRLAIRAEIAAQRSISWNELFKTRPFRKRLAVGTFVWAAAMLSGISFVQYCKPTFHYQCLRGNRTLICRISQNQINPLYAASHVSLTDRPADT